jgi:hypothetical protein
MIIKFGSLKVFIKHEDQDLYTLDLIHFANENGAFSKKEQEEKINKAIKLINTNIGLTTNFLMSWNAKFMKWLDLSHIQLSGS